jgi:hypothetical protein
VAGVLPDGALAATAKVEAEGSFSAANPPLTCGSDIPSQPPEDGTPVPNYATLTSGSTTFEPGTGTVATDPNRSRGANPAWTMQGQAVDGPLSDATAALVSNSFPFYVPKGKNGTCGGTTGAFAALFDQVIGGIDPQGDYYNGVDPELNVDAPPGETQLSLNVQITSVDSSMLPTCSISASHALTCPAATAGAARG